MFQMYRGEQVSPNVTMDYRSPKLNINKHREGGSPYQNRRKQQPKVTPLSVTVPCDSTYAHFCSQGCLQHVVDLQNPFETAINELSVLEKLLLGLNNKQNICMVCSELAVGYNFGVLTCKSCCAFFRQTAKKIRRTGTRKLCANNGKCHLYRLKPPQCCEPCHFRRCLNLGMTLDEEISGIYDRFIGTQNISYGKAVKSSKPEIVELTLCSVQDDFVE